MNSRVSWSVDGIDPTVRERAEAAARRAGMSLNDWLNSTIGEASPPNFREPYAQPQQAFAQEARAVDDIHQRLDSITRQIEQISKPAPRQDSQPGSPRDEAPRNAPAVARQLNDAISRLDARLSQISNPPPRQTQQDKQRQAELVERAAAQVYRPSPPLSPSSFDSAIAEIAARQNELDAPAAAAPQMPPRSAPPMAQFAPPPMAPFAPPPMAQYAPQPMAAPAPAPAGPDFSSLERHLVKITSQIEALQRPDHIEQSIAAFRSELAEIRHAITEAMPRRAIESIENEIRSLSRRIDDSRQSATDGQALANVERALSEIREVLRSLTPAEQLAGYDDAIRNLGAKLDLILRANDDPSTVHQLEGAIAALRSIVSNVASNDALARLSDDVQMLSSKVDQIARSGGSNGDAFAVLEQRIAALSSSLESRERPAASGQFGIYRERAAGAVRSHRPHAGRQRQCIGARASRTARVVSAGAHRDIDRSPRQQSRPRRGCAAGHSAPSREPARQSRLDRRLQPPAVQRAAAADGFRHRRHGQARIVRHPLQPVGNRPPHPGRAGNRSLHARPCGRSPRHDRRRSARGALGTGRSARTAAPAAPPAFVAPPAPAFIEPQVEAPRAFVEPPDGGAARRDAAAAKTRIAESGRKPGNSRASGAPGTFRRRAARIPRGRARRAAYASRSAARDQRNPGAARRTRAPRSSRSCRRIIRWSRAHGRPPGCRRRRSASPLPKAR